MTDPQELAAADPSYVTDKEAELIDRYWSAANYLSVVRVASKRRARPPGGWKGLKIG